MVGVQVQSVPTWAHIMWTTQPLGLRASASLIGMVRILYRPAEAIDASLVVLFADYFAVFNRLAHRSISFLPLLVSVSRPRCSSMNFIPFGPRRLTTRLIFCRLGLPAVVVHLRRRVSSAW